MLGQVRFSMVTAWLLNWICNIKTIIADFNDVTNYFDVFLHTA